MLRLISKITCLSLGVNLTAVSIASEGGSFWAAAIGGGLLGGFVVFTEIDRDA